MPRLEAHTAGESHGPALISLIQGLPSGVPVDVEFINGELKRRQGGYGRGGRQKIETDVVDVLSGVRLGRSTGGPITFRIPNKDSRLDDLAKTPRVHRPRPGHADLAGSVKWLTTDCRDTLERASARETAARVACGALARCLLREFGIAAFAFVRSVGTASTEFVPTDATWRAAKDARDASDVACPDAEASERMRAVIHQAKVDKDTAGGLIECHVFGCPIGLGSCVDWRDKLDARLAYAAMGIQAIKSVEIGMGKDVASLPGSRVHDPIRFDTSLRGTARLGFTRDSNNAGGTEGGMTNAEPVVVRAAMKPIATLLRGMPSVDLNTKESQQSSYERSDICAVPAASVVLENVVAFEIARVFLEKFGGDSLLEIQQNHAAYLATAARLPLETP
ncbi:MAG: chorismate synthase [Phycisphaerales bacterium]